MRVYVPTTVDELAGWYAAGAVPSTDDAFLAPDDTEEGEYAALMAAAEASAALLSGLASGSRRRVVVVAETQVETQVPFTEVVAVHADTADRPVDADPDDDLGWFATQEIPDLL